MKGNCAKERNEWWRLSGFWLICGFISFLKTSKWWPLFHSKQVFASRLNVVWCFLKKVFQMLSFGSRPSWLLPEGHWCSVPPPSHGAPVRDPARPWSPPSPPTCSPPQALLPLRRSRRSVQTYLPVVWGPQFLRKTFHKTDQLPRSPSPPTRRLRLLQDSAKYLLIIFILLSEVII